MQNIRPCRKFHSDHNIFIPGIKLKIAAGREPLSRKGSPREDEQLSLAEVVLLLCYLGWSLGWSLLFRIDSISHRMFHGSGWWPCLTLRPTRKTSKNTDCIYKETTECLVKLQAGLLMHLQGWSQHSSWLSFQLPLPSSDCPLFVLQSVLVGKHSCLCTLTSCLNHSLLVQIFS